MGYTYTPVTGSERGSVLSEAARVPLEQHEVVYARPWVVELILDLASYTAEKNLVDSFAIEPAASEGAFLLPMVRRLW